MCYILRLTSKTQIWSLWIKVNPSLWNYDYYIYNYKTWLIFRTKAIEKTKQVFCMYFKELTNEWMRPTQPNPTVWPNSIMEIYTPFSEKPNEREFSNNKENQALIKTHGMVFWIFIIHFVLSYSYSTLLAFTSYA